MNAWHAQTLFSHSNTVCVCVCVCCVCSLFAYTSCASHLEFAHPSNLYHADDCTPVNPLPNTSPLPNHAVPGTILTPSVFHDINERLGSLKLLFIAFLL